MQYSSNSHGQTGFQPLWLTKYHEHLHFWRICLVKLNSKVLKSLHTQYKIHESARTTVTSSPAEQHDFRSDDDDV